MKAKENDMYKQDEIRQHYIDWLAEQPADWIEQNQDDLHHHCFNTDYYIIGRYKAVQWLGRFVFEVINIIKEYEQDNFGQVTTDFSSPEKVANMYAYIVGEKIVYEHKEKATEDEDDFDCDECGELTEEVYTGKDGGFYCEDCIK